MRDKYVQILFTVAFIAGLIHGIFNSREIADTEIKRYLDNQGIEYTDN